MQFNHDNLLGVGIAEDLVNLDRDDHWNRIAVAEVLRIRMVRFDLLEDTDVAQLHSWVQQLRGVFTAAGPQRRQEAANALLDQAVRHVHLNEHDGLPAHLHFADDDDTVVQRVMAATAGGIAVFTVEAESARMGACGRTGCGRVFADTSRNGRRAYCSARCANTAAVSRSRQRQRAERPPVASADA